MLNLDQPIFSYAGALKPEKKGNAWPEIFLATCVGLLLAALAI
jgi:hypothetical protein